MTHWPQHARRWSLVGPPLRPCADDIAAARRALPSTRVDALVLGVTPELMTLPFAQGSTITAVDREPAMIDLLFAPHPDHRALVGDWLALPLADASVDIAFCDGGLTLLAPEQHRVLAAELARVLRPGGRFVVRLFASPASPAPVTVGNSFDALKWRIAMAIATGPARTVAVADIRAAFDARFPDRAALAAATGWPRDKIDHIDVYRGSSAVYAYPTVDSVRATFATFTERACHVPTYELGDCCPTLTFERHRTP